MNHSTMDSHVHYGDIFIDFDGTELGREDVAGLVSCTKCSNALTRFPCELEPCQCGSGMHDACCCGLWISSDELREVQ